jgi:hypothetical protein
VTTALARRPAGRKKRPSRRVTKADLAALGAVEPVVAQGFGAVRVLGLPPLVWGGVIVLFGSAAWLFFRNRLGGGGALVPALDAQQQTLFKAALPAHARPYGDIILSVAAQEGVDPFAVFALGDRESLWGTSSAYKQDTGDWAPRAYSETKIRQDARTRDATPEEIARYKLKPAPVGHRYVMPADGLGWGRGIMQIDYNAHYDWIRKGLWKNPRENVWFGTTYLKALLKLFGSNAKIAPHSDGFVVTVSNDYAAWIAKNVGATYRGGTFKDPRPLTGRALIGAAVAAYNTGPGNVIRNIALGAPAEASTTGRDYTADTLRRQDEALARFQSAGGVIQTAVV